MQISVWSKCDFQEKLWLSLCGAVLNRVKKLMPPVKSQTFPKKVIYTDESDVMTPVFAV